LPTRRLNTRDCDLCACRAGIHPPASISYLFLAYPLAILATHVRGESWLHEHFVQLYHAPSRGLKVYTHPHCTSTQMAQVYDAGFPGIVQRLLDPRQLQGDPLRELRMQLSLGVYPQIDVDMGRLGLTGEQRPFLHEILLCGCDPSRFEVLAFNTGGRLRRQWVEAARLAAALDVDGGELLRAMQQQGESTPAWLRADWSVRPKWILHEPTPGAEDAADPDRVLQSLAHYMTSRPPVDLPEPQLPADQLPANTRWGHAAQSGLVDVLRQRGAECPLICFRLWWEHKKLMARRLKWLTIHLHRAPSFEAEQMEVLARRAGALRMTALRLERRGRLAGVTGAESSYGPIAGREDSLESGSPRVSRRISDRLRKGINSEVVEDIARQERQLLNTLLEQAQWVGPSEADTL
jgi:hypothetical protein